MGSCNSGDQEAEYHCTRTYLHVTLRNHNRNTALERSVIDYWGLKHALLAPNPRPLLLQWFQTFGSHEGFANRAMNQHRTQTIHG